MRVLNDREEKTESTDFGFLALISHMLMTALGVATLVLSPLPIILSHLRLVEPWPKVATLLGAIIAILFLEVPVGLVLMSFAFGIFVADGVTKKTPFWRLLGSSVLLSLVVGFFALVVSASFERISFIQYWVGMVDSALVQAKEVLKTSAAFDWSSIRSLMLYQGPFLYVAGAILSFWLSIGVAAHIGWLRENEVFSAVALRKLQLPGWLSFTFVVLFFASAFAKNDLQHLAGGAFRVIAALMFVQGMVTLSLAMAFKQVRPSVRGLFYSVSVLLGFYMVVGIGVFSPWIFRKKLGESGNSVPTLPIEEAV